MSAEIKREIESRFAEKKNDKSGLEFIGYIPNRLDLERMANSGTKLDIDFLMSLLYSEQNIGWIKLVDYVLGLVDCEEGALRIKYYLFSGSQIQRNYAALFFCRRCDKGDVDLLWKAVNCGCIDEIQAFSK
jgi:hypothetical protein